ncbi:hypothetical protein D8771_28600 [Streptomyces albus]|uniref:Uncharacterized protein n=1 Tax=Streptomyces albus TaxID=1888 RepID=A0A8H1QKU0_9ACTN|nr:hypothetical protein D8771_28600 [Streptomyces albus]
MPAITPERQPRATLSRNLALCGQALPRQGPPCPPGGDPSSPRGAEWLPGCGTRDRAWPIVVHQGPRHKGFVTYE